MRIRAYLVHAWLRFYEELQIDNSVDPAMFAGGALHNSGSHEGRRFDGLDITLCRVGISAHFYLAIGLAELCGAGFLLIPKLARSGAILLIVIMIGATVTHLLHREPQVVTTLVLTALLVGVVYLRRAGLAGALKGS
jgi:uncharacterized membrane protein YphA (DoxX/SURF4 family)